MKVSQIFTVRNESGQLLATYRAFTEQQAIERFLADQNTHASTFRRSAGGLRFGRLTASVEG